MSVHSRITSVFRNLFASGRVEHDLDDELRAYVEMSIAEKRNSQRTRRHIFFRWVCRSRIGPIDNAVGSPAARVVEPEV
jgi:hypothetical protein